MSIAFIPLPVIITVVEFMVIAALLRDDPLPIFGAVALANLVSTGIGYYLREYWGVNLDWILFGSVLIEGGIIRFMLRLTWLKAITLSLAANVVGVMVEIVIG